jgi:hypothetical protein
MFGGCLRDIPTVIKAFEKATHLQTYTHTHTHTHVHPYIQTISPDLEDCSAFDVGGCLRDIPTVIKAFEKATSHRDVIILLQNGKDAGIHVCAFSRKYVFACMYMCMCARAIARKQQDTDV